MTERNSASGAAERFMPCVLTRLTDQHPEEKTERIRRSLSLDELKESILANIRLILNSRFRPEAWDLGDDPLVESSVLGFGLTDCCGVSKSREALETLRDRIRNLIVWFEPRLDPASVEVSVVDAGHRADGAALGRNGWALEISARINVEPLTGELLCISEIDLESGAATVESESIR